MAKSRARKLADIIVGAGIDIDGNLTFDGGSVSADLTFGDNDKANFGDASDLQIYHNSNDSIIREIGTGRLVVGSSEFLVTNSALSEAQIQSLENGAVSLYHDGNKKVETTSTGVLVSGDVRATNWFKGASDTNTLYSDTSFGTLIQTPSNTNDAAGTFKIRDSLGVVHFSLNTNTNVSSFHGGTISSGAITSSGDVTLNGKLSIEHDGSTSGDVLSLFSNRFNQTSMYGFGLESGTLYYKANVRHQFYSGSNYDNASYDVQFDGSSFVIRTGDLKMGASTFVDESRNITAGTISSGAITSSGNIVSNNSNVGRLYLGNTSTNYYAGAIVAERSSYAPTGRLSFQVPTHGVGTDYGLTEQMSISVSSPDTKDATISMVPHGGNVGIGTSSPDNNLHVKGTTSIIRVQSTTANQNASIWFNSNVGGTQADRWEIGTNISAAGDLEFFDRLNSASRMVIEPSGNVGIGTISPAAPLDVQGSTGLFMARTSSGLASYIENDGGYAAQYLYQIGGSPKVALHANGSSYFNGGNVGIGTTSPKTTLNLAANNSGQGPILTLENTDTSITTNDVLGQIDFYGNDGSTGGTGQKATIQAIAQNSSGTSVGLSFGTSPFPNTTATERMRIMSDGQIRIGSGSAQRPIIQATNWGYSASYRVALLGSASTAYNTQGTGSVTLAMNYDPSGNSDGSFSGDGREILFRNGTQFVTPNAADNDFNLYNLVLKDGKVGIGTSSPDSLLHLKSTGDTRMTIESPDANDAYINFSGATNEMSLGFDKSDAAMYITNHGTITANRRVTIKTDGNVGIGTTSPYSKLNVQGTSASTYTGNGPGATIRASQSTDGNWIASDVDGKFAYFGVDGGNGKFAAYNYASNAEMGVIIGQETFKVFSDQAGIIQSDGDYLAKLHNTNADGYLSLYIGTATPTLKTKISSYGTSFFNSTTGQTAANQALVSIGEETGAKAGYLNVNSAATSTSGGIRHRMSQGTQYLNVASAHTGSGSLPYWHIKTSIYYNQNVMFVARVHGYAYGNAGHIIDMQRSGYAYANNSSSITGSQFVNNGSYSSAALDWYYTAAGQLCFRAYAGASSYYTGWAFDIKMQSPTGYNHDFVVVEHNMNATSGNYYT